VKCELEFTVLGGEQSMDFDAWFEDLRSRANFLDFELGDQDSYRDYFDDGDSPDVALDTEMSYADE